MTDMESLSKVESIYRVLEGNILSGKWNIGFSLPTEFELAAQFECGRHTISQVITRLVHEGLVERRRRSGTRVVSNSGRREKSGVELKALAFIYPTNSHDGHWGVAKGFREAALEFGQRVITLNTGSDYSKEREYILRLSEFDVQGAALHPHVVNPKDRGELLRILNDCKFPVVLTGDYLPGTHCSSVVMDSFHAGYTMTRYLLDTGLRRVGFFSNQLMSFAIRDCYRGYCWALQEREIELSPELVLNVQESHDNPDAPLLEPTQLARAYLQVAKRVEGVVCAEDYLALGMIHAAQEVGLNVPGDLRITGINDFRMGVTSKPALTTYRTFCEVEGRKALELLNKIISGKELSAQEIHVPGELVIRESA
jgi:GntR family transcriptional regulator of arabinose operon